MQFIAGHRTEAAIQSHNQGISDINTISSGLHFNTSSSIQGRGEGRLSRHKLAHTRGSTSVAQTRTHCHMVAESTGRGREQEPGAELIHAISHPYHLGPLCRPWFGA